MIKEAPPKVLSEEKGSLPSDLSSNAKRFVSLVGTSFGPNVVWGEGEVTPWYVAPNSDNFGMVKCGALKVRLNGRESVLLRFAKFRGGVARRLLGIGEVRVTDLVAIQSESGDGFDMLCIGEVSAGDGGSGRQVVFARLGGSREGEETVSHRTVEELLASTVKMLDDRAGHLLIEASSGPVQALAASSPVAASMVLSARASAISTEETLAVIEELRRAPIGDFVVLMRG